MPDERVVVIGAGVGGLVSAALLAARGCDVTLVEAAAGPGGKLRAVEVGGAAIDGGPTVFTMRDVFEDIFAACGAIARRSSDDATRRRRSPATPGASAARPVRRSGGQRGRDRRLRRRRGGARLSRVPRRGEAAVRRARPAVPARHQDRSDHARLADGRARASPTICNLRAYTSLWRALGGYFRDPRLRQLFGRYATYCGSSPFACPATLMLIAHVEASGVWLIDGGMHRLALALEALGARAGVRFRYDAPVREILVEHGRAAGVVLASGERIARDAVVCNADPAAIGAGAFGAARPARDAPRAAAAALAQRDGVDRAGARRRASRSSATTSSSRTTTRPSSPRSPPGGWPTRPASTSARRIATTPAPRPPATSASRSSSMRPPTGDGDGFTPAEIDTCTRGCCTAFRGRDFRSIWRLRRC